MGTPRVEHEHFVHRSLTPLPGPVEGSARFPPSIFLADYEGYPICSSAVLFTPFAFILVCLHGDLWMHFKRRYQWLMRSAGALGSTPAALPPALEGIIAHLCLMHIIPQDAWPKELLQVLGRGAARLKIPH